MLCFAVDQANFDNDCVHMWIHELRYSQPQVPIVLVLTKNDLLETEMYKEDMTKIKFDVQRLEGIKAAYNLKLVLSTNSMD